MISSSVFQTVDECPGREDQCALLCATASGMCLALNGFFIDGTPCVGGGFCQNGSCSGSSVAGMIDFYFRTRPEIAITVTVLIGLLVLSMCVCGVRCCCNFARRKQYSSSSGGAQKSGSRRNEREYSQTDLIGGPETRPYDLSSYYGDHPYGGEDRNSIPLERLGKEPSFRGVVL